ncbi:hypothetical protein [Polymorphobacter megasporae]|uniref:hypothetical protein n=1 Tax=Glacieibacterium megasporae TaxID=2835787 RepID=UPI001C1E2341|nr:hypothetical protein [Polymorphobacter megasporae]UAJ11275.1 hypothetical protein KTC28_06130 [Polymorphobacter megasporae]
MRQVVPAFCFVLGSGLTACTATPPEKSAVAVATTVAPAKSSAITKSCVQLNRVREARVVDDRTIDFYLSDREVLRNTLPNSCPQLGFERAFSYSTSLSQLCSVDIITVIIQGGGPSRGASCGLGPFVPYTSAAK